MTEEQVPDQVNMWDEPGVAANIDAYWSTSPVEAEWRRILLGELARELPGEGRLLEAGCGSGLIARDLFDAGLVDPSQYVGIDISREMLSLAQKRLPATKLQLLSLENTGFKNRAFEAVMCVSVLQHLEDYRKALAELIRITDQLLYVVTWMHEGEEDIISYDGRVYNNVYSIPKLKALTRRRPPTIQHLYLNNYSVMFERA